MALTAEQLKQAGYNLYQNEAINPSGQKAQYLYALGPDKIIQNLGELSASASKLGLNATDITQGSQLSDQLGLTSRGQDSWVDKYGNRYSGSNPNAKAEGGYELKGTANYFYGLAGGANIDPTQFLNTANTAYQTYQQGQTMQSLLNSAVDKNPTPVNFGGQQVKLAYLTNPNNPSQIAYVMAYTGNNNSPGQIKDISLEQAQKLIGSGVNFSPNISGLTSINQLSGGNATPTATSTTAPATGAGSTPTPPPNMTPEQQKAWDAAVALIPKTGTATPAGQSAPATSTQQQNQTLTVKSGDNLSTIVKNAGITPQEFLALNPQYKATGLSNDWQGLTGLIKPGQTYVLPPKGTSAPSSTTASGAGATPTPGSGTYGADLATSLDATGGSTDKIAGTSDAIRTQQKQAELDRIKAEMEAGLTKPTLYKSADEYEKLRKEQGIVDDENELNSIQNEINLANEDLRQFKAKQGPELSMGGYTGRVSEAEQNVSFRLESLAIREKAALARVNTKNAFISNMLQLGQQDYTNAMNDYNAEYSKNIKAIELYNQELDDQKKDALTSFTTITNLLKDKNIDPSTISSALKTQLQTAALQAGLPADTFELLTARPNEKVLAPMTVDNASGGKDVYFFTQDEITGQPHLVKTYSMGGGGAGGTGGGATIDPELSGIVNTIIGSGKFTKDQANAVRNAINTGEDPFTVVKNRAKDLMSTQVSDKTEKYEDAKSGMLDIQESLSQYYAAGGKTNLFKGSMEDVINKLGEVNDPKLVALTTQIKSALQVYRNAISGTAYSEQEGKDIASIFPGINKSEGLNQAIIEGRISALNSSIDSAYINVIGSGYNTLKDKAKLKSEDIDFTLKNNAGADGYVSPDDWFTVKMMYLRSGGTGSEFDSQYKQFKNPWNKYYK